jgi:hypothetical protein
VEDHDAASGADRDDPRQNLLADLYVCMYVYTYVHKYIYTYVQIHQYMYSYMYMYVHTYTYTHIYTHACLYCDVSVSIPLHFKRLAYYCSDVHGCKACAYTHIHPPTYRLYIHTYTSLNSRCMHTVHTHSCTFGFSGQLLRCLACMHAQPVLQADEIACNNAHTHRISSSKSCLCCIWIHIHA